MVSLAPAVGSAAAGTARVASRPAEGRVLAWLVMATSAWLVGGIYLDGWAHNHDRVDSFFTPWHAVLYAGYAASAAVAFASLRRVHAGGGVLGWRAPAGYGLSVAGALVFGLAGGLDMLWHLAFGVEASLAALLSPTHLLLATGAALISAGPLRAAWLRAGRSPAGFGGWLPVLASIGFILAMLTFMTQFAHPLVWPEASVDFARPIEGSDVYVMAADGAGQTRLTRAAGSSAGQATWSPDGLMAYVATHAGDHSLAIASADGSQQRVLLGDHQGEFLAAVASRPAWSPDGRWLAFVGSSPGQAAEVYLVRPEGGSPRRLTSMGVMPWSSVAWSPDSRRLAFAAENGTQVWLYLVDVDGGVPVPLVEGFSPSWSPDGTRLAFTSLRSGALEVYTVRLDGTDLRQLTRTTSQVMRRTGSWSPAWSADGSRIAFASSRDGALDVFLMDADGGGQVNLTHNAALDSVDPAWLPDGRLSYTGRARGADTSTGEALGVAAILLQAGVLAGVVLVVARRWRLPLGAWTALFALNAALLSSQTDNVHFVASAALAGGLIDLLLWRIGRLDLARPAVVRALAFGVPAIYFGAYFAMLAGFDGIGWSIHLWAGSIVLAGVVGLLLSLFGLPAASPSVEGGG